MKLKKNYKVIVSEPAKSDLRNAAQYYNSQQRGLGTKFLRAIKDSILIIRNHPEAFQIRFNDIRIGIPNKFPYLIFYNVNYDNNEIRIIAILHSAQNPEKWKDHNP